MAVGTPVVSFGIGGVGAYLNEHTNGTAGLAVGTKPGDINDLNGVQWPVLLADLATSVLCRQLSVLDFAGHHALQPRLMIPQS